MDTLDYEIISLRVKMVLREHDYERRRWKMGRGGHKARIMHRRRFIRYPRRFPPFHVLAVG